MLGDERLRLADGRTAREDVVDDDYAAFEGCADERTAFAVLLSAPPFPFSLRSGLLLDAFAGR